LLPELSLGHLEIRKAYLSLKSLEKSRQIAILTENKLRQTERAMKRSTDIFLI
jgi:hypothetical protein